jgi:hypothetical protein
MVKHSCVMFHKGDSGKDDKILAMISATEASTSHVRREKQLLDFPSCLVSKRQVCQQIWCLNTLGEEGVSLVLHRQLPSIIARSSSLKDNSLVRVN